MHDVSSAGIKGLVIAGLALALVAAKPAFAVDNVMLPLNCSELLPDESPFLGFFESLAQTNVKSDPRFSKRLFRVLAIRNKVREEGLVIAGENPVDTLIRKTLCYYREQKEPVRPIPFDDVKFLTFMKAASYELEQKVEQAVYQLQLEKYQRQRYENQLKANRRTIEQLREEAQRAAATQFNRLSQQAQKKAARP